MIEIEIEYPFMLFKRKAYGRVPSSWEELTEKQFVAISRIISGESPDYRFLSLLTGITKEILRKLSSYELLKLSEQINFFGHAGSSHSDFIIRELSAGDLHLIAPKPKLADITFGQFIFMDSHYSDYFLLKEEAALNKFIACTYLQPGEKFSNERILLRSEVIGSTEIHIRKAIAFNYSLIVSWLQKAYPLIFRESLLEQDPPSKEVSLHNSAWINIFESMVGEDLINRDHYAELPIHTVLRTLTKKYKENARR